MEIVFENKKEILKKLFIFSNFIGGEIELNASLPSTHKHKFSPQRFWKLDFFPLKFDQTKKRIIIFNKFESARQNPPPKKY